MVQLRVHSRTLAQPTERASAAEAAFVPEVQHNAEGDDERDYEQTECHHAPTEPQGSSA